MKHLACRFMQSPELWCALQTGKVKKAKDPNVSAVRCCYYSAAAGAMLCQD